MPSDNKRRKPGPGPKKRKSYGRKAKQKPVAESVRLNRFIAQSGVCSRREADSLITEGKIKVNGKKVIEVGTKVLSSDRVEYNGKRLYFEKPVYIVLNKPKDFITSLRDERGRKTVMDLVRSAGRERIFPVGRLDKNTTGVLLLTNDGELTKQLTHPSHEVTKIYHVTVDKTIEDSHLEMLRKGFDLVDGFIKADEVSRIEKGQDNELGLKLHSGRNRIVRRMMEHLGLKVLRLDRVVFANLDKKDLPRGKWRRLDVKEITFLKRLAKKKHGAET